MDPSLDALWAEITSSWSDDSKHKAFIVYCRETGQLDEAARRYRVLAEGNDAAFRPETPEQTEEAKKRLAGVVTIAVATLDTTRTPPPDKAHKIIRVVALIVFVLIMGLLAYALSPLIRR